MNPDNCNIAAENKYINFTLYNKIRVFIIIVLRYLKDKMYG